MVQVAQRIVSDGLSVRQTEELVKRLNRPEKPPKTPDPDQIYYDAAERELGERLGRKIRIHSGKRKGRLELEYYNVDDLNDLLEALHQLDLPRKGGTQ